MHFPAHLKQIPSFRGRHQPFARNHTKEPGNFATHMPSTMGIQMLATSIMPHISDALPEGAKQGLHTFPPVEEHIAPLALHQSRDSTASSSNESLVISVETNIEVTSVEPADLAQIEGVTTVITHE